MAAAAAAAAAVVVLLVGRRSLDFLNSYDYSSYYDHKKYSYYSYYYCYLYSFFFSEKILMVSIITIESTCYYNYYLYPYFFWVGEVGSGLSGPLLCKAVANSCGGCRGRRIGTDY